MMHDTCKQVHQAIDEYPEDLFERPNDELITIIRKTHKAGHNKEAYEALFFSKKGRNILNKYIEVLRSCQIVDFIFEINYPKSSRYIEDCKDRARFFFSYKRGEQRIIFSSLEDETILFPVGAINKIVNDELDRDKIWFLHKKKHEVDRSWTLQCLISNQLYEAKEYQIMRQKIKEMKETKFKEKKAQARIASAREDLYDIINTYSDIINEELIMDVWNEHAIEMVMS